MNTLYEPPVTNSSVSCEASEVPASRKLAFIGSVLLAGPLFGAVGTIIGMIRAFSTLSMGDGNTDPSALAGDISIALMTTLYGAAFGLIGVVLVSIALFRRANRERWFFKSVVALSVLWCLLLFPVGLAVGIYLLVVFWARKGEFYPQTNNPA